MSEWSNFSQRFFIIGNLNAHGLQHARAGHDIDFTDQLAVYSNENFLGYLYQEPNNDPDEGDSFFITDSEQLSGKNRIKFVLKTAAWPTSRSRKNGNDLK